MDGMFVYHSVLSPAVQCMSSIHQAPVVQRMDNLIQWIKCIGWSTSYLLDKVIRSLNNWDEDEERLWSKVNETANVRLSIHAVNLNRYFEVIH